MKVEIFEKLVEEHSLKPNDKLYNSNALSGECGEIANAVKKIEIRKSLKPEQVVTINTIEHYNNNVKEELGDVLFYLTRLALDSGITLSDIMARQIDKINKQDLFYKRTFLK